MQGSQSIKLPSRPEVDILNSVGLSATPQLPSFHPMWHCLMLLQFTDAQAQEIPTQNSQYAEFPDTLHTWLSDFPHASCSVAVGGLGGQAGHNLQSRQKPHQNHVVTAGTLGFCPIYSCLFLSKPAPIPPQRPCASRGLTAAHG